MSNKEEFVTKAEFKATSDEFRQNFKNIDQRFEGIDLRFIGVDQRFDRLEGRFDNLEGRFDGLENRFDELMEFLRDNVATKTDLARLGHNLRDYTDRKIGDLRGDLVQAGVL